MPQYSHSIRHSRNLFYTGWNVPQYAPTVHKYCSWCSRFRLSSLTKIRFEVRRSFSHANLCASQTGLIISRRLFVSVRSIWCCRKDVKFWLFKYLSQLTRFLFSNLCRFYLDTFSARYRDQSQNDIMSECRVFELDVIDKDFIPGSCPRHDILRHRTWYWLALNWLFSPLSQILRWRE